MYKYDSKILVGDASQVSRPLNICRASCANFISGGVGDKVRSLSTRYLLDSSPDTDISTVDNTR